MQIYKTELNFSNFKINNREKVAFKANPIIKNLASGQGDALTKTPAFEMFIAQLKKAYPNEKIMNVLLKSAVTKNFLGSGRCAKVYEIPNVKDFVVRILHNTSSESILNNEVKEVKDEFPNHNFGQKIADNENGITILKRVQGQAQSFPNPSEKDDDKLFLIDHARRVSSQIADMANFPQESFDRFALKVKEINKSPKYILDCLNPNNLLVDKENQEFNIVDLSERNKFTGLLGCKQDSGDMISLLLNIPFHRKIYDKLPTEEEKELFKKNSRTVIEKTYKAAQNVGLQSSQKTGAKRLKIMNDYCLKNFKIDFQFLSRYRGFKELYKDLL